MVKTSALILARILGKIIRAVVVLVLALYFLGHLAWYVTHKRTGVARKDLKVNYDGLRHHARKLVS